MIIKIHKYTTKTDGTHSKQKEKILFKERKTLAGCNITFWEDFRKWKSSLQCHSLQFMNTSPLLRVEGPISNKWHFLLVMPTTFCSSVTKYSKAVLLFPDSKRSYYFNSPFLPESQSTMEQGSRIWANDAGWPCFTHFTARVVIKQSGNMK